MPSFVEREGQRAGRLVLYSALIYVVGHLLYIGWLEFADAERLRANFIRDCQARYETPVCERLIKERSTLCLEGESNSVHFNECMYRAFNRWKSSVR